MLISGTTVISLSHSIASMFGLRPHSLHLHVENPPMRLFLFLFKQIKKLLVYADERKCEIDLC